MMISDHRTSTGTTGNELIHKTDNTNIETCDGYKTYSKFMLEVTKWSIGHRLETK